MFVLAVAFGIYAFHERTRAEEEAKRADALRLAAQAREIYSANQFERSVLLALESLNREPSLEGYQALRRGLALLPRHIQRLSHESPVNSVAFSPDGKYLATAGDDGIAQVWEITSGKEVARMRHEVWVRSVAFSSPNGKYLATASDDNTARVWDWASDRTDKEVARMNHDNWVRSVAFSPDGEYLATASDDNTARVWDWADSKRPRPVASMSHEGYVTAVAFSPDGKYLATASRDKTACVWDWSSDGTDKQVARMNHDNWVRSVAFSPDGEYLATASSDDTARVWDWADSKRLVASMSHEGYVTAVAFSPDGKYLATASLDNTARLWDRASSEKLVASMSHEGYVTAVAFSPDGKYLATGSQDKTARVCEPTAPEVVRMYHEDYVAAVAFSPDGKYLATASEDSSARVWEAASGEEVALMSHEDWVRSVAFSPDGKYLATASEDNSARVWEIVISKAAAPGSKTSIQAERLPSAVGKQVSRMSHEGYVTAVAFSPDGKHVATGSEDDTAVVWEIAIGKEVAPSPKGSIWTEGLPGAPRSEQVTRMNHDDDVTSVAFSPDGKYLATGCNDNSARVWEATTGTQVAQVSHGDWVRSVAFSPDGKYLATASDDNSARVWEAISGREVTRMNHEDCVTAVAFSPDGEYLATGTEDNTARVWQRIGGEEVARISYKEVALMSHEDWVRSVAFSPDGRYLATASDDGTAEVWFLESENLISEAYSRLSRNLTYQEWQRHLPDNPYRKTCPNLPIHPSLVEAGTDLAKQGEVEKAIAIFRRASELDPSLVLNPKAEAGKHAAKGLVEKGVDSARKGDREGAIAQFQRALELDPSLALDPNEEARRYEAAGLVTKGEDLAREGDVEGAIARFQRARLLDPSLELDPQAEARWRAAMGWVYEGQQHAALGKVDEAAVVYAKTASVLEEGLRRSPDDERLLALLGVVYHEYLFKYQDSYEQFRKVLELKPDNIDYRANFAEANLATERFKEAYNLARELLTESAASQELTAPQKLAMRFVMVSSRVLQGRTEDAEKELEEFVNRYNSVVDEYEPGWSYKGTKNFIAERAMDDEGQKRTLLTLIEILETPPPNMTLEAAQERFGVGVRRADMPEPSDMTILGVGSPLAEQAFVPGGGTEWYRFTVTDTDTYQIDATAGFGDPEISLYGPDDVSELVGSNDDWGDGLDSRLWTRLRPGEYYLGVREFDDARGRFNVEVHRAEIPEPGDMTILEVGSRLPGQAFAPSGEIKWYRFRVSDAGTYQIDVTSRFEDPAIRLYGPNDVTELVGMDDDGGGGFNSRLRARLLPGEYYLGVVELEGEDGSFDVQVRRTGTPKPSDMMILEVGSPLAGEAFAPDGGTRWYRFTVTDSGTYQIDVISESGDPMIDLYGPDDVSELVGMDDDGGGGLNSRLRVRLQPGEYYLDVVELDGERGSFDVTLQRSE
jgi:WD40 repeat protein/Flp pilus assembly protein TadD